MYLHKQIRVSLIINNNNDNNNNEKMKKKKKKKSRIIGKSFRLTFSFSRILMTNDLFEVRPCDEGKFYNQLLLFANFFL